MELDEFEPFRKIARLNRDIVITEKIDGTNAQVLVYDDVSGVKTMKVGSRNKWLSKEADNYGFFAWSMANRDELLKLGYGRHYGEWWGQGINSGYGLKEKRFSLFNTSIWNTETLPKCCSVVPTLYKGPFSSGAVEVALGDLELGGSIAAPGFMNPEGIVIYHVHGDLYFKVTLKNDGVPKGMVKP